jgi:tRNA nucleotidyltransferase (CCA-adding enzyme)
MELMKLFKNSDSPSTFFYMLGWWGWLEYHFKELAALSGVPQSLKHHPEGDAFVHTMYCLDQVPKGDWFMRAVMLCHDLGKATHTLIDGVKWHEVKDDIGDFRLWSKDIKVSSPGHEAAGIQLCYDMLKRISFCSHSIIRKMGCLVKNHMVRAFYNPAKPDKVVRPILRDLMQHGLNYIDLERVVFYDLAGRPPLQVPKPLDIGQAYADYLIVNDLMTPVVTGELLMANGLEPGEVMGKMVKRALELQDRGTLNKDNWKKVLRGGGFKEYFKPELAPSGDIVEDGDIYPLYMDDPHYDDMQSIIKDPEQG